VVARLIPARLRPARHALSIQGGETCVFCGSKLSRSKFGICTGCHARPRTRSIPIVLREAAVLPCLAFSAAAAEKTLLRPLFPRIESVSLFGRYGNAHRDGVDARNLSGIPDSSCAAHYSCLLFDYFPEHESALAEAFRVLAPGGVFLTHIQDTRLSESRRPPKSISAIRPRPGYYDYIPADSGMHNVRVGALWVLDTMSRLRMTASRYRIVDGSGVPCDWFVGWKS
jgi:SAM-dependent methyltransferase